MMGMRLLAPIGICLVVAIFSLSCVVSKSTYEEALEGREEANQQLADRTQERDILQNKLATSEADLDTITKERDALRSRLVVLEADLTNLTGERDRLAAKVSSLESELAKAKTDLTNLTGERDRLAAKVSSLEDELVKAKTELLTFNSQVLQAQKFTDVAFAYLALEAVFELTPKLPPAALASTLAPRVIATEDKALLQAWYTYMNAVNTVNEAQAQADFLKQLTTAMATNKPRTTPP